MVKFSILVPAYNAGRFLKDNLYSVLNQTYSNWELIVVDDGSTDNTLGIIQETIARNPDANIRYISIPNGGLANARNKAMSLATGDYFCNLDADDFLGPETLERVASTIAKEKCEIYYYDIYEYDEVEQKSSNYSSRFKNSVESISGIEAAILKLQRRIWICQGVAFYDLSFVRKIGLTNHEGVNQGEDLYFITSALACASKVKYVSDAGAYIRYRSDSMMHAPFNQSYLQCIKAIDFLKDFIDKRDISKENKGLLITLIRRERILQELRIAKSICDAWGRIFSLKNTLKTLKKYSSIQSSLGKDVREILPKSHLLQYYIRKYTPILFVFSTKIHRYIK